MREMVKRDLIVRMSEWQAGDLGLIRGNQEDYFLIPPCLIYDLRFIVGSVCVYGDDVLIISPQRLSLVPICRGSAPT